jgi:hypothetical protein
MLLAASAGVLGAAALFAGPAFGDTTTAGVPPPTISIGQMQADGSVQVTYTNPATTGVPSITVSSLTLTYNWAPTDAPPTGVVPPAPQNTTSGPISGMCTGPLAGPVVCTYAFPTSMMNAGTNILNGNYELQAAGQDCVVLLPGGCTNGTATQNDGLANPATTPTGVTATTGPKGAAPVTISWTPSPEPDVAGYYVFRNDGSVACHLSEFDPIPASTSCQDTNPGGGTFTYTVKAARFGTSYSSLLLSNASAASESVTVTGPPATTTTVPKSSSTTLPSLGPSGFKPVVVPTKIPATGGSGSKGLSALPAAASSSATTPSTSGGGYNPLLPYGSIPQPASPTTLDPAAISVPAPPHKGSSIETIAVVGAGLLVAVLALHGLWLRSEVRRAGTLEPLDPEA